MNVILRIIDDFSDDKSLIYSPSHGERPQGIALYQETEVRDIETIEKFK